MGTRIKPISGTLIDAFSSAAERGGGITILNPDGSREERTHEEILSRAATWARGLHEKGIERGDRVGVTARTSHDFITGTVAIWMTGGVVIPIQYAPRFSNGEVWTAQARTRLARAGAKVAITTVDDPGTNLGVDVVSSEELGSPRPELVLPGTPEDTAVIQFSSGSTTQPKGIVLSHRTVCAHLESARLEGRMEDAAAERIVSWMPLFHDFGFIEVLLISLATGASTTMMPPEMFLIDPMMWLTEIHRLQATQSHSPGFGYAIAARNIERGRLTEQIDLSSWCIAGNGSERIDVATLYRFADAARPYGFDPAAFACAYGLAEATCGVTSDMEWRPPVTDVVDRDALAKGIATPASGGATVSFVSCGTPLPGYQVRIAKDGSVVGDRVVGEIQVNGPALMDSYLDDAEATEAVFSDGWLLTGDLGYLVDGELHVIGRAKDTIIINGQNIYPEDVELAVGHVEGIRTGSCIAFGVPDGATESLVVIAETRDSNEAEAKTLARAVSKRVASNIGVVPGEVRVVPIGSVPKTSSGKLQRGLGKELYLKEKEREVGVS